MTTPTHAIINLVVLGRVRSRSGRTAVFVGAILPDLPMYFFYFVERVWMGHPESLIWSESYYAPHWQDFFDLFNSLPLIAIVVLIGRRLEIRWLLLLGVSMALHVCLDLPLHHDDAHRHFYPLSDWRFESPVSYWDPAHFGSIVVVLEVLSVVAGSVLLWRRRAARRALDDAAESGREQ